MSEKQSLSDVKAALLAARLRGQRLPQADAGAIGPRPAGTPDLLSFGQERLWFLQQLNPRSAAYNMHHVVRLHGPVDAARLGRAVDLLVRRHASLRTAFRLDGGLLVQAVGGNTGGELVVEDVGGLEAACARATQLVCTPFDLQQAPLLRAALLRLGQGDHLFVLVIHHIVADEWSLDILWRELAAGYNMPQGAGAGLAPLGVQYADFAHWQRSRWTRGVYAPQLTYWKQQLSGELPLLQLPTDRPRPRVQRFRGAFCTRRLPHTLLPALHACARDADASVFMLLAAALDVLLFRWTGQQDLLVGTPIANRTRPELEPLVGFFLNTLVLRNQVDGAQPFRALLAAVRESVLGAFAHQDLPFEKLVDELNPQRDPSYNPLFQVMLVYQTHSAGRAPLAGLQVEPLQLDYGAAKLDLTLFVTESAEGLEAAFEYNSDLFDAATVQRMLDQLAVLLEGIAANPDCAVGRLPLLPPAERALLQAWNDTSTPYPAGVCIHDLIAAHAASQPETPALYAGGASMRYGELDRRAAQVAQRLRAHGVRPGVLVPLCVERSFDMIVGILAILKAGGAYVPLDPGYPRARLAAVIEDVVRHAPGGCPLVLAQRGLRAQVEGFGAPVLILEDAAEPAAAEELAPAAMAERPSADDLAYVIYTSGSTGRPKGVMVTHGNLVNSTTARFAVYPGPAGRFLLLSSFAFDSSLVGIFWTLCQGGTLVLPPARVEQDMGELARSIAEQAITHLLCLPSLYELLLTYAVPERLASLRTVIVAGEVCPRRLVQRHLATLPGTQLYNEYGPTEATVWSTVYAVPAELPPGPVAIGRPIANLQVHVLDTLGQPLPIGAAGELYVGGRGVAAGYLGQAELTAQRFVMRDGLALAAPGREERLYRTGDLVRYRADGNLEYLGRSDQQVKIRGYRIELEEIERTLAEHPGVGEVVVIARAAAAVAPSEPEVSIDGLVAQLAALDAATRDALLAEAARLAPAYTVPPADAVAPGVEAMMIVADQESR